MLSSLHLRFARFSGKHCDFRASSSAVGAKKYTVHFDPEEKKEEEEEEEEVIKIEALNATPKTFGLDVVKNTGIGQRKLEYPEQGYAIVTKVN